MSASHATADTPSMRWMLYGLFFVSGACGLVHEVVWTRLFGHMVGSSTHATSMVLSVFMGGLALGGYTGGKVADRTAFSPLMVLVGIECGIGLFALAMPWLIQLFQPVYAGMYAVAKASLPALTLARFGFSVLLLIIPTTLMGATLPVMTRFLAVSRKHTAAKAGGLYSVNTFGAVVGSFSAGFVLLPGLGVSRTILVAAGGNLAIGAVASFLSRKQAALEKMTDHTKKRALNDPTADQPSTRTIPAVNAAPPAKGFTTLAVLLLGYGLSGFAALSYEVAWTRVLAMMIGSSIYAFTMILTAFVTGLALGSAICSRVVQRFDHPLAALGGLQVLMGAAAFMVVPLLGTLPFYLTGLIARHSHEFWALQGIEFAFVLGVTILPTLLMGAAFPLVTRIFALHREGIGESVGTVYGANTLGTILGASMTGLFLIPWLGTQQALYVATAMNLVAAMLFFSRSRLLAAGRRKIAVMAFPALLFACGVWLIPSWNPAGMTFGPFYEAIRLAPRHLASIAEMKKIAAQRRVLFHKDGPDTTVTVKEFPDKSRALYINGKPDASSHGDLPSQLLVAHLPLMLHPAPKETLVIGLASGITLGSAALYPVDAIDCLEISPTMVEASHYFKAYNHNPLANPVVNLIVEDGRNHLALTRKTYDIIISEPSNPYFAGMADLFTREFFDLMRGRLNPGGIACAWVQTYLIEKDTFRSIVAAFQSVFPRMTLWKTLKGDCMMVGAVDRLDVDFSVLAARFEDAGIRTDLARIGIHGLPDLLGHLLTGPQGVEELTQGAIVHTDDNLIAEFAAPKALIGGNVLKVSLIDALEAVRRPDFSYIRTGSDDDRLMIDRAAEHVKARGMVYAYYFKKREQRIEDISLLQQAHALNPNDFLLHEAVDRMRATAFDAFKRKHKDAAIKIYQDILTVLPDDARANYNLATLFRRAGRYDDALNHYARAVKADPDYYQAHFNLAAMYAWKKELEPARSHYEKVIRLNPDFYPAMVDLADLLLGRFKQQSDSVDNALGLAKSAARLTQYQDPRVLWTLSSALEASGQVDSALEMAQKALPLARKGKKDNLSMNLYHKIIALRSNSFKTGLNLTRHPRSPR